MVTSSFKSFLKNDFPHYFEFYRRAWWETRFFPTLRRRIRDNIDYLLGN